eukprot:4125528-Pleurochrysis_carterae.AAC.1
MQSAIKELPQKKAQLLPGAHNVAVAHPALTVENLGGGAQQEGPAPRRPQNVSPFHINSGNGLAKYQLRKWTSKVSTQKMD